MTKPGTARSVVIPMRDGLKEDIVLGLAQTLGISSAEMKNRLAK